MTKTELDKLAQDLRDEETKLVTPPRKKRRPKGYFLQLVKLSRQASDLLAQGFSDSTPLTPYGEQCLQTANDIKHILKQIER